MGDISEHFNRREFRCKCRLCQFDTVDVKLISVLEDIRETFAKPVVINSGSRCVAHNVDIGGSLYSQHIKGRAADIVVKGVKPSEVQDWVENYYPGSLGLGRYDSFTHIDTRNFRARWDG